MQVGVSMPELSDAGWQTAERAGALSLMPYADVQRLARLYAFQDLFERQEERMIEPISKLAAWFLGRDNPLSAPPKDLESLRAMMIDFRGALYQHQQLTEQLGAAYATYGNASP
jgi:hypothetical protein